MAYQIESSHLLSLSQFSQQPLSGETMDPTLVSGTHFESQFQICVYEHAILRIYIIIIPTFGAHIFDEILIVAPSVLIAWLC